MTPAEVAAIVAEGRADRRREHDNDARMEALDDGRGEE